jgi:putative transcriptional regulator
LECKTDGRFGQQDDRKGLIMDAFSRIMDGLDEAVRHASGEDVPELVVHVPASLDVAKIRERTALSQPAFARTVGVSVATLRQWEQRRRCPEGPARVLLALVERDPNIVLDMLGRPAEGTSPPQRSSRGRHI